MSLIRRTLGAIIALAMSAAPCQGAGVTPMATYPAATTPLTGAEQLLGLQAGQTVNVPVSGIANLAITTQPVSQRIWACGVTVAGCQAGSDTSGKGTNALPYATVTKAFSVAQPGATLVVGCGTYSGALLLSKSITIEGARTQSMTGENCVKFTGGVRVTGSGVNVTLKDAALDGVGSASWVLYLGASALRNSVTLTDVLFANLGTDGVATDSNINTDFTANNTACSGTFSGSCYDVGSWGAGSFSVNGIVATVTSTKTADNHGTLIFFDASSAGVPASVSYVTGTNTFSSSSTTQNNAIELLNAQPPTITHLGEGYGQNLHATPNPWHWPWGTWFATYGSNGGSGGCNPVFVGTDPSNVIESDNLVYTYNWAMNDCLNGGHTSILVNSDGDPGTAQRNKTNNPIILHDRETTGPDVTTAATPEGFLPGWLTNPTVAYTVTENWPGVFNGPYGPIAKGVTGGLYYSNLVINPGHTGIQIKGGAELNGGVGPTYCNNTIIWNLNPASPTTVQGLSVTYDEAYYPATGYTMCNNAVLDLATANLTVRYAPLASAAGSFTGSISGTTLTTSTSTQVQVGQGVAGAGVTAGTEITAGSGTTWTVNNSQTVASEAMTTYCATNCYAGTWSNNNYYGMTSGTNWQGWDATNKQVDGYASLTAWQTGGSCSPGAVTCSGVEPSATGNVPSLEDNYTPSAASLLLGAGTTPPSGVLAGTDLGGLPLVSPYPQGALQNNGAGGSQSLSTQLDNAFGSAQGTVLYRGASGWSGLAPGTSGQALTTKGASANPAWASAASTASTSNTPTAPASTSSFTMQGLAGTVTPATTGAVQLTVSGTIVDTGSGAATTAGTGIAYAIKWGTGTAPTNGAVSAGNSCSPVQTAKLYAAATATANVAIPFGTSCTATMTAGTTYWIDMSAESAGTASAFGFSNLSIQAQETH